MITNRNRQEILPSPYILAYAHNDACIHVCMHTYMHKYIHNYIHTHRPNYTYMQVHTCIHAYIHTYIHTYDLSKIMGGNQNVGGRVVITDESMIVSQLLGECLGSPQSLCL